MANVESPPENTKETKELGRRHAVPIIHVRGTHYDIGFDIGRTFARLINDYVKAYRPLNETYLPLYETEGGKKVYEETLACAEEQFPGYVREIRGTADGAQVPFHKLFLMHLDDIVPNVASGTTGNELPVGCSTIICNHPGQEILGHNEDALSETLNHWYLVSAHVVEPGSKEEKFTSLSYAGFLPGYTMGYNHHGLIYTINTLSAATLRSGKTPRYFLTRALLAAEDYAEAERTLRNEGYGAAEGFSVNITFLGEEGERVFRNIEVGPCDADAKESQMDILTLNPGDNCFHCNKYIRLGVPEVEGLIIDSSVKRMAAICKHPAAKSRQEVAEILSDQTDDEYRVYQEIKPDDYVKTIATGIFDCIEKTWSIYTDKPNCNEPILVIALQLREKEPAPEVCEKAEDTETSAPCENGEKTEETECCRKAETTEETACCKVEKIEETERCEKAEKTEETACCEKSEKTGETACCEKSEKTEEPVCCEKTEKTEETACCEKTGKTEETACCQKTENAETPADTGKSENDAKA